MGNLSNLFGSRMTLTGGFKNKIINGNFDIWQRGTSFTSLASGNFTADRFKWVFNGTMDVAVSKSALVPTYDESGIRNQSSLLMNCQTADTDIDAGNYCFLMQRIEGYNIKSMMGKSITLSFWVYASLTGTYCISFRNKTSPTLSYVSEYVVNEVDTWEKKIITLTMHTGETGTWDFETGEGLSVSWVLASGSTYQTTTDSWQSGNYLATSNQVNAVASSDYNFRLANVQLEIGSSATDIELRSIDQELALCQRYYEKSYNLDTAPGTVTAGGQITGVQLNTWDLSGSPFTFKVTKRATPTSTVYSPDTGDSGKLYDTTADGDIVIASTSTQAHLLIYTGGSGTADNKYALHWVSDAEI